MLGIFALSLSYSVRQRLVKIQNLENREKLRLIADAGVKKAVAVLNQKKKEVLPYDALKDPWSNNQEEFGDVKVGDGRFSVMHDREIDADSGQGILPEWPGNEKKRMLYGMVDEERKLNLNVANAVILARLFQLVAGVDEREAHDLAVSIIDWRDPDDFRTEGGAESYYYKSLKTPYAPRNADFVTLEELLYVKGMTPEIYKQILPYVTLNSMGKVNLNTAPRAVLRALGFSESLAQKVLTFRAGKDGVEGTSDDYVFKNLSTAVENLYSVYGLNATEKSSLESFVGSGSMTLASENFTVKSVARLESSSHMELTVICVVKRFGEVSRWQEKFETF